MRTSNSTLATIDEAYLEAEMILKHEGEYLSDDTRQILEDLLVSGSAKIETFEASHTGFADGLTLVNAYIDYELAKVSVTTVSGEDNFWHREKDSRIDADRIGYMDSGFAGEENPDEFFDEVEDFEEDDNFDEDPGVDLED